MAKTAFSQWDTTAANNTDINSIPLSDSMLANQIDDAFREMMAQLKGAGFITTTSGVGATLSPTTTDGAALGSTTKMWSDLFLASGGVINWNNGDVTLTHSANQLAFGGASSGYVFDANMFLPSGGVISFNTGDVTITHSTNQLNFAGASVGYLFDSNIFLPSGGTLSFNLGDVTLTHSANALAFAGASSGYSFDAAVTVTGNMVIGGTNALNLGAGGQVVFPATQNASSDANTLDDYEELNEAAVSQASGISAGSGTITTASGDRSYTKIGRLVVVTWTVTITTVGTGGDSLVLTLPFTAAAAGGPWVGSGTMTGELGLVGKILESGTTVAIREINGGADPVASGVTTFFTISYWV